MARLKYLLLGSVMVITLAGLLPSANAQVVVRVGHRHHHHRHYHRYRH